MALRVRAFCLSIQIITRYVSQILGPALVPRGGSPKNYGNNGKVVIDYLEDKKNNNRLVPGALLI